MRRDRAAEGVEKEETWGGVSPHHPTRGPGEHRKLPSGSGEAENGFYAYMNEVKKTIWNALFCIFEQWRGPNRRGARENFPPPPPSRWA